MILNKNRENKKRGIKCLFEMLIAQLGGIYSVGG